MDQRAENDKNGAHLGIKQGSMLQVQVKGGKGNALSSLIGKERGQYLIIHTPSLPGFMTKLNKENQVIVRYVHDGIVFGFQCTLIHFMDKPFRISFLTYPEHIETMNLRSHKRITCFLPASAKIRDSVYEGVVLDLSVSGCGFHYLLNETDAIREVGKEEAITFSMQLTGGGKELTVEAIVRSVRLDSRKIVLGAQFNNLSSEISTEIENYIQKIAALREIAES